MKRIGAASVVVLVVIAGFLAGTQPWQATRAQEEQTITVEVEFEPTSANLSPGDPCGYLDIQTTIWPHSKQVVVTDAAGVIVATVDLLDIFNPAVLPAPEEAQAGTVNDHDFCVVSKTISVSYSPFYTFAIDGTYRWTVSRADLEERNWMMRVTFYT